MDKIIVIVGPTATGKTKLGIELAKEFNGEIINADAYQVYKHLDIATAKPTLEEQATAKHHLIDIKEINERYSAYEFMNDARNKISEISKENKLPIIVGGSGFFLQSMLGDRVLAKNNEEVPKKANVQYRKFNALIIGLNFSKREGLYTQINSRVDEMIEKGLENEVNFLYDQTQLEVQSAHAIGYSQFKDYFNNQKDLKNVLELIKRDSRHYAKRQITFFKNQFSDIHWFNVEDNNYLEIKQLVKKFISV
ncbi:MAG: tRNA (adenosine(37)-N6)-dimethylallyltransferase MiaA [Lactobacillaceae bacterium]|jgi:tRNA dimethylallyltransferase|nr:tRNA (adenosine(37)-N6)-dimethylallyltransferase MiaA [Lactobacillaceae bacterium]